VEFKPDAEEIDWYRAEFKCGGTPFMPIIGIVEGE
jgi:hypothetical protein